MIFSKMNNSNKLNVSPAKGKIYHRKDRTYVEVLASKDVMKRFKDTKIQRKLMLIRHIKRKGWNFLLSKISVDDLHRKTIIATKDKIKQKKIVHFVEEVGDRNG